MFEESETRLTWQTDVFKKEKSTWEKIFGTIGSVDMDTMAERALDSNFEKLLEKKLEPNLSLQELSVKVIESALEIEFGDKAKYDMDDAEMTGVLSAALRKNPEMREQMLAVANMVLRKKLNVRKKTVH